MAQIITGADELKLTFAKMQSEFGPIRTGKGLITAVKSSLKPALSTARSLVPVDTGALRTLLRSEARKPSRKDKRSQYVLDSDTVIGVITTPPAKKLEGQTKRGFQVKLTKGKEKTFVKSDARAIAQEFGTANHPAKPFLRPALESQQGAVIGILSKELFIVLQKYRKKGL